MQMGYLEQSALPCGELESWELESEQHRYRNLRLFAFKEHFNLC